MTEHFEVTPVSALISALGPLLGLGMDYIGSEGFQNVLKTGVVFLLKRFRWPLGHSELLC